MLTFQFKFSETEAVPTAKNIFLCKFYKEKLGLMIQMYTFLWTGEEHHQNHRKNVAGKITCTLLLQHQCFPIKVQLLIRWNKSSTASLRELVSPLFLVLLSLKQQTYGIKTLDIPKLNSLIHSKYCNLIQMVYEGFLGKRKNKPADVIWRGFDPAIYVRVL